MVHDTHLMLSLVPLKGKDPLPRPGYQMAEPNGCGSYIFGLPVPEGVCFFCLFRAKPCGYMELGHFIDIKA